MSVIIKYFVHGTTTDNLVCKATGWNNGELSEKGISQVLDLKEKIDLNEIDFVIQTKNEIIPIEVKSGKTTKNISLTRYNEKFKNNLSIRISSNNMVKDEKILNIPIFLLEYIEQFVLNIL